MTFQNFSAGLIKTLDLDPDYVFMKAVAKEKSLTKRQVFNWIILKVFVYNTPSEYRILFKGKPLDAFTTYGQERVKNKNNTKHQMERFNPSFSEEFLEGKIDMEYSEFKQYITGFLGIGDWAAWKMADLMERVMGVNIKFDNVDFRTAYKFPLKGLVRVNGEPDEFVKNLSDDLTYHAFMKAAIMELGPVNRMEAPGGGRMINIQEIETCLCKYHSYLNGHYKLGQDFLKLYNTLALNKIELPESIKEEFGRIKHELQPI